MKAASTRISWANAASWLCLIGSILNPLIMSRLAFSGFMIGDRKTTSNFFFLLVFLQVAFVVAGLSGLMCLPENHKGPIIVRIVIGALIGLGTGAFMFILAAYAGVGP